MRFVLGIDIGGTNLVVGSVAEDGSALHALGSEPTGAEAGERDVLDRLIALATRTIEQTRGEHPGAEIIGIGVGAPGPLDTKSGVVLLTPNLGWVNLPLRQIIHDRLKLPAALDNDETVPPGIEGIPPEVSVTVAMHIEEVPATTGVPHETVVAVARFVAVTDVAPDPGSCTPSPP